MSIAEKAIAPLKKMVVCGGYTTLSRATNTIIYMALIMPQSVDIDPPKSSIIKKFIEADPFITIEMLSVVYLNSSACALFTICTGMVDYNFMIPLGVPSREFSLIVKPFSPLLKIYKFRILNSS